MNREKLFEKLRAYVLEISSANNYITNYMDSNLEHIAERLTTDFRLTYRSGRISARPKSRGAGKVSR